jgi:AcrR family transcriptional regulator
LSTPTPPIVRRPRADAERNRQRLLEAAKSYFAANGAGASLEEIARLAKVGIGTLYRHFPTRDALVEEVYRQSIEQLAAAAATLSETEPPIEALRQWLQLFVDYLADKKLLADALGSLPGGTANLYAKSGSTLQSAIKMLTDRAVLKNDIHLDAEPLDLLRAIAGVANASPTPGWETGAKKMVDILIVGISRT